MKVFRYEYEGSTLYERSLKSLLAFIQAEIESMQDNEMEEITITISTEEMTEEQLDSLPEFEGF